MGNYINPGNTAFREIRCSTYIDKSDLIYQVNKVISTKQKLLCVSRPRRFGKSYDAQMLCAYYDRNCDSSSLFCDLSIASDADPDKKKSYLKHLNKYDVIYLDMTGVISAAPDDGIVPFIKRNIIKELQTEYPSLETAEAFHDTLANAARLSENRFIMIIDEWDAPVRELPEQQNSYLMFLRSLFKNSSITDNTFAAVYMTGILPIKKDGSESAVSDFNEYTILDPGFFADYTGFTENDVKKICSENGIDFQKAKTWYDGYKLDNGTSIYNPYSIMNAALRKKFRSYWRKTSASEALLTYIDMDEEGLQGDIIKLMSGETLEVDTEGFENDTRSFKNKDDVLTLMIHLGYLTCVEDENGIRYVKIPNKEVEEEFTRVLRRGKHHELLRLIALSDQLLDDTINCREDQVAAAIKAVHDTNFAPTIYNEEQSLRYVIKMAYISSTDQYLSISELPSGHGYADLVFLPKRNSPLPALIIELKWNKSAESALDQIRDRNYPAVLKNYGGKLLLVGINYDAKTKAHTCKIEEL